MAPCLCVSVFWWREAEEGRGETKKLQPDHLLCIFLLLLCLGALAAFHGEHVSTRVYQRCTWNAIWEDCVYSVTVTGVVVMEALWTHHRTCLCSKKETDNPAIPLLERLVNSVEKWKSERVPDSLQTREFVFIGARSPADFRVSVFYDVCCVRHWVVL